MRSFLLCECEPGAYRIQLKYGVDNYDIKMYLKNIRASEVVQICSTSQNKSETLPMLFSKIVSCRRTLLVFFA